MNCVPSFKRERGGGGEVRGRGMKEEGRIGKGLQVVC